MLISPSPSMSHDIPMIFLELQTFEAALLYAVPVMSAACTTNAPSPAAATIPQMTPTFSAMTSTRCGIGPVFFDHLGLE